MTPPSPSLSARMMNITYLIDTISVSDQNTSDTTPYTSPAVGRTAPLSMEKTVWIAYSGLVPMSPNTTPSAPSASARPEVAAAGRGAVSPAAVSPAAVSPAAAGGASSVCASTTPHHNQGAGRVSVGVPGSLVGIGISMSERVRVHGVAVILLLVVLATGVAASARRLRVPAPSLLVVAGLLVALV